MDTNYANAGGGGGIVGAGGESGVGASVSGRYNAVNYQRSGSYNPYDPYGGSSSAVRMSSVYPYDAEAEFKERTGMGKSKTNAHVQLAGNIPNGNLKMQQHSYNPNSCYGSYNQSTVGLAPESANYYAYAYDQQHHHYSQQQQQQQYHQSQLQQQYKYNVSAKAPGQQQSHHHHQQQQQQQQQNLAVNTVNTVSAMKMSPPEYGYAPYHHPYYHPHYHHPATQKGGVGVMKTIPDASAIPYVNSKMIHSATMGGARVAQYPSNYAYHPHSYPSTVSAGHHTYQSQSVCDDSRWMWNPSNGSEFQSSCRSAYPPGAYVNGSGAKQQPVMWPSIPMQYQNTMSTAYPTAVTVANQVCCPSAQSSATYYPQQYVKYPVQSLPSAMDYNGSSNGIYSNSQGNSAATGSEKVYTDLNAQPQANAYQTMNASSVSYHQPGDYNTSTTLDYHARYLQDQQTESPSSSSTSSTSSYNHHYYHPYAHQTYSATEPQDGLYTHQQEDTKIGLTTKSQSLRDFLTTWNEDEDECSDRTMSSTDVPFMEQLHMSAADHFTQTQDGLTNPIVENHLQFKGSFTSRPKIHVGITVDSTVESDQYINLPDIIIDIEKSNKDVVSLPEDVLVAKLEKEEIIIKEEKPPAKEEVEQVEQPTEAPPKKLDELRQEKKKFRRKFLHCKRISQQKKLRLIQRNQRKLKVPRKLLRPKIRRVKKQPPRLQFNPQTLKCLCVSLINSDKFRNRILGPSEIDSLINFTTDNEVNIDVAVALAAATSDVSSITSSVIPKLSDLCKNALNSSFDRDVLVINLDEILDSDNLFVVQCDINENILENYVDQQQLQQEDPQQQQQQQQQDNNNDNDNLVEILNDNNNNYNSGSSNFTAVSEATATSAGNSSGRNIIVTQTIEDLKRCCSVTEVSNLPLDNAVEHNNLNLTSQPLVHPSPLSPLHSSSCPAALSASSPSSPLIEQNCSTQQITVGHEQLHEMLMLSGIVHDEDHLQHDDTTSNDGELLMSSAVATPSTIHHEEIVPDNLKKFQNEKFLKYLHAKYVQGNLSEFYHANRIIKKYKKRIIKKILSIVR